VGIKTIVDINVSQKATGLAVVDLSYPPHRPVWSRSALEFQCQRCDSHKDTNGAIA
jgi:hypothetical protein